MSAQITAPGTHQMGMAERFKGSAVKVICVDVKGDDCGHGSGIRIGDSGIIITCAHLKNIDRTASFSIIYSDNMRIPAEYIFSYPNPDLMGLRAKRVRTIEDHSPRSDLHSGSPDVLVGGACILAQPVFTLSFPGAGQQECSYSEGSIRTSSPGNESITASTGPGSSGGACFKFDGRLVGMIQGAVDGAGDASVKIVSASNIQMALQLNNLPTLGA